MRRPESADSSTARVAMEGALGAAENIECAERTMMVVCAVAALVNSLLA